MIVSPALADANNGNWQTARRWQRMLSACHSARIVRDWPDAAADADDVMLALHARKSAPAVQAWVKRHGSQGLAVVMTGTDLYRDIASSPEARACADAARRLVVLQDQAPLALPAALRSRARVIYQSTSQRATLPKTQRHLRAVMVGHLRDEKDPLTLMAAAKLLRDQPGIHIDHIGAPLDAALGRAAQATMRQCPGYRWLGALPHEATRRHIQRAHLLVHASRMEGGAHVVMEAVRCGTPVLASRIDGNTGMLGAGYSGYFEAGDAAGLAALLLRCHASLAQPGPRSLMARLGALCERRAPLFDPNTEQAALCRLVNQLWKP